MPPLPPLEPADAATAAAMLAHAAAERIAIAPQGHGTKRSRSSEHTSTMLTTGLTRGLTHYAGDLVAVAPAGCTLRAVNDVLAQQGQWIPLDPPHDERATIGGIVSANDSGARRHRFGAPRDLVIGIEVALTSGMIARAGGRVVKNVAGYDLGRLFCGSRGSLGLITSVTFKLAPLAAASRTVVARFARPAHAIDAALRLAGNPALTPTALELITPDPRLLVRFESTERAAELMAQSAAAQLSSEAAGAVVLSCEEERSAWTTHQQMLSSVDGVEMNVSVLPASAAVLLDELDRISGTLDVRVHIVGRPALGVFRVRFVADMPTLQRAALTTREQATRLGGHAQVTMGAAWLDRDFDVHGAVGSMAAVARAVKQQFDPAGILPSPWSRP